MLTTLVLTAIGADRSGLVRALSTAIADNGGNWLESRMCRLGGQFAGILRVEVATEKVEALTAGLAQLQSVGLSVEVLRDDTTPTAATGTRATLDTVGQDQPGILRRVTGVLAARGLNIEDLTSERTEAPMGGGTLFRIRALLTVPPDATLEQVRADLEAIAPDLMVELKASPV